MAKKENIKNMGATKEKTPKTQAKRKPAPVKPSAKKQTKSPAKSVKKPQNDKKNQEKEAVTND